ncbi:hypothetical protein BGZ80_002460 [Entomortierella chlamydospora]|uniref:Uncharacterized protein n=1 Tax=Entomortierella chlamydospora TaxID=101097 RepID=A0A9P6MPU4_9FUNG|nr:hypothetical protein BGZ79_006683 [Entomortierella chlamydospora]KAG0009371.1 hypothetical protein BGZ80_002460 [Entomortierella chlamydospora]
MDSIRTPFVQAIQDGYINQISLSVQRRYSLWFFMAGLNLVMMGKLMDWYLFPTPSSAIDDATHTNKGESQSLRERRHQRNNVHSERELPRELGYWFLGIGVTGALAIPKSGFYLLGLQGLAIIFSK